LGYSNKAHVWVNSFWKIALADNAWEIIEELTMESELIDFDAFTLAQALVVKKVKEAIPINISCILW